MPNPGKQMKHQSWAAGYADGYIAGLEEAWARVNAQIQSGRLPADQEERRQGLLLARDIIASPNA